MPNRDLPKSLRIEMLDDMPVARLGASHLLFDHAVTLVTGVIRRLASEGTPHLLIDASLVRFAPPTLVDRLRMVREWADAAEGRVRIAMLTRPEFIDPERFGIVAAGNFGLAAQVFDLEADAIAWLRAERSADLQRSELRPAPRT
jgi:hypothetical protein